MDSSSSRGAIVISQGSTKPILPRLFGKVTETSSLLEYVLDSIWTVADELYVVFTSEPDMQLVEAISPFGVRIIIGSDTTAANTTLAAVKSIKSDQIFVTKEQYPFIKPSVALYMFEAAREFDAAVPKWNDGRTEPFLSVYRRKSLVKQGSIKASGQLPEGDSLERLLGELYGIKFVSVETELKTLDPELFSFFFVNDESKAKRAMAIAGRRISATKQA
jgi:molybdopterin-guanine dinucleotide biosynthesis protein A